MKYSFKSDYCELAHPALLMAFDTARNTQFEGYGLDEFSLRAADIIRSKIESPLADVHFIGGGTHANLTAISSFLRPHEAVIAPVSGHICVHEAGAVEATGHKVCAVDSPDGKLTADDIINLLTTHDDEHMVSPRLVYISNSTETGTVYKKEELAAISKVCRESNLLLYIDGARLGAALNSSASNLSYTDIANLSDAFYIGGTKNGALFGEAIVITNDSLKKDFRVLLKQRGALLSKGAAIGIQFEELFKDGLYDKLAQHANLMAYKLARGIEGAGFSLANPVETNMLFPIFPTNILTLLKSLYSFYDWKSADGFTTVRLVTSWATPSTIIDEFITDLKSLCSSNGIAHC